MQSLKEYVSLNSFSKRELYFLNMPRKNDIKTDVLDKELYNRFISLLPLKNSMPLNYKIGFAERASIFIEELFKKEVTEDTIILSTRYEHGNVTKHLINKNTIFLDSEKDLRGNNLINILKNLPKNKKVFVYVIGTQLASGEITPQSFYLTCKEYFVKNNIDHVLVIDDVHGLFLVPRDYSIFDYILFTMHALVPNYNLGILFSKKQFTSSFSNCILKEITLKLKIILKNKDKMLLFKNIITNELKEVTDDKINFRILENTSNHIFS